MRAVTVNGESEVSQSSGVGFGRRPFLRAETAELCGAKVVVGLTKQGIPSLSVGVTP